MTQPVVQSPAGDQALVHQFIRLVGRAPTETELARYQEVRSRTQMRLPRRVRGGRLRRTAARLVLRL